MIRFFRSLHRAIALGLAVEEKRTLDFAYRQRRPTDRLPVLTIRAFLRDVYASAGLDYDPDRLLGED